jgi:osmotically inducible protein OsmC
MARIRQRRTGKLTTQSNTLANTQYSFKSRFEDGGTNPEELIAAAHSGFAMQLSAFIEKKVLL